MKLSSAATAATIVLLAFCLFGRLLVAVPPLFWAAVAATTLALGWVVILAVRQYRPLRGK